MHTPVNLRILYIIIVHSPELCKDPNGWYTYNYAENFDLRKEKVKDNVQRIDASQMSAEEFREKYEQTYTPVVITNCQKDWAASYKWNLRVRNAVDECGMFGFHRQICSFP